MSLQVVNPRTWMCLLLIAMSAPGCGEFAAIEREINGPSNPSRPGSGEPQPTPEPSLSANFVPVKGAPAFDPLPAVDVTAFDLGDALPAGLQKSGQTVVVQKDYPSAEEPHRTLGMVILRSEGSKGVAWGERVAALRVEAGKRGANTIVSKGCRHDGEACAAMAFHLSSTPPAAAKAPQSGPSDAEIVAAIAAQIPGATVITNTNATGGGPSTPSQTANLAAAEEVLAAIAKDAPNKDAVPNNKALIAGLVGLWMPDASGSIPEKASTVFERELLRSIVYVDKTGGKPKLTKEGMIVAYTDEKSAPKSTLVAVPAARLLELAAQKKVGVYLHYEGESSLFHGLTLDRIGEILAGANKKK